MTDLILVPQAAHWPAQVPALVPPLQRRLQWEERLLIKSLITYRERSASSKWWASETPSRTKAAKRLSISPLSD